ncbi:MAG: hypothetical protein RR135_02130, partial [Oscillospiraceae bacterium]
MLHVPQLDDLDYQALMDRARAMIPTLTDEWTDLNDHDPGITTLQVFAWLCDGLNYYINATGEQHRLKYLKLLGIEPMRAATHCRVAVSAPDGEAFLLPRGSRLAAGETMFELTATCSGVANRLIRLYSGMPDALVDVTAFAGQDGEFASVFSADGTLGEADLGFACALSGTVRLLIEVDDCGRNPFWDDFSLADAQWECCDGAAWQLAEVILDETSGLLRSGYLVLRLPCETAFYADDTRERAHYLRCRLTRNEYDVAPRVGRVIVNCADAVQICTRSEAMLLAYDGSGTLEVDRAIAKNDLVAVAVQCGDAYRSCEGRYVLKEGAQPYLKTICFDKERFGWAPEAGAQLLVVVTEEELAPQLLLGTTDGCAEQAFDFDQEDLFALRLALLREEPDGEHVLTLWDACSDLSQAGFDDRVFWLDVDNHRICFGDGLHGLQPEAGQRVLAVTVKTSQLDRGNVLGGQLNRLVFPKLEQLHVSNPGNATGGVRAQSAQELEVQIERKLHTATRAVTAQDLRELVLGTPGLLIDSVAVIPMRDYCAASGAQAQPNTILVAVKPHTAQRLPMLGEIYRRRIRAHLEPKRLLTTDLRILPAQYVGVSVFGRIALTENHA